VDWTQLVQQKRNQWQAFVNTVVDLQVPQSTEFLEQPKKKPQLFKEIISHTDLLLTQLAD
jgi:hypothetical protein